MPSLKSLLVKTLTENALLDKIKNPATGRMIQVRSALSYPQDHAAHKAALQHVLKAKGGKSTQTSAPKLVTPASRTMTPGRDIHPDVKKYHTEITTLIKNDASKTEIRSVARKAVARADDMFDDVKMMFMKHNLDVDTHAGMGNFYGDHEKLEAKDSKLAAKAMNTFMDAEKLNNLAAYASMHLGN